MDQIDNVQEPSYRFDPTDGTFQQVTMTSEPTPAVPVEPAAPIETPPVTQTVEPVLPSDPPVEVTTTDTTIDPLVDTTTVATPEPEPEPATSIDPPTIELDDNFYKVQAQQMMERGELPQDFNLEVEDLGAEHIMQGWEQANKNAYIQNWQNQAMQQLQSAGFNQTHLELARRLDNGVSTEDMEIVLDYRDLSTIDTAKFDDDQSESYLRDYFKDISATEFAADATIEAAKEAGKIKDLLETAKSHFDNRFTVEDERTALQANQRQQQRHQIELKKQSFVSNIYKNRKIGNTDLTENEVINLHEGMTRKTIPYNTDQGVQHVTAFDAFTASLNDFGTLVTVFNALLNSSTLSSRAQEQMQAAAEDKAARTWGTKKVIKQEKPKTVHNNTTIKASTLQDAPAVKFDAASGQFVPA